MTENTTPETLIPIWDQHRDRILSYGYALHALLPEGDPPVTLHGRDLRPLDEGVGFQFQYTLAGDLYGGDIVTACFVIQVTLIAGTSVRIKVDAAPLLEYRDGRFDVFHRRSAVPRLHDARTTRLFFAESLMKTASRFFSIVRAGEPWNEFAASYGGTAPTRQVVISE